VLADAEAALALLGDEALALAVPTDPQLSDLPGKSLSKQGENILDLATLQAALNLRAQLSAQSASGAEDATLAEIAQRLQTSELSVTDALASAQAALNTAQTQALNEQTQKLAQLSDEELALLAQSQQQQDISVSPAM